jgi:anti-anti-sigma regulatory factor
MTLPDTFDIATVREQHAALLTAFAEGGAVVIDASRVVRADAAAMQLLYAAAQHAARHHAAFTIAQPSAPFITVARTLGLARVLCPDAVPCGTTLEH